MRKELQGVTFQQIEIFLCVAKYENMRKAAQELHMTTASVSRNITALENEIGIILFVRYRQHIRLTNAGQMFAAKLPRMAESLGTLLDKAYEIQKCQYNTIHIGGCSTASPEDYMLPVSRIFSKAHPDVDLKFSYVSPEELVDGVADGHYDIAFNTSIFQQEYRKRNLEFRALVKTTPCFTISSSHPLFNAENIKIKELIRDSIVTMDGELYGYYRKYVNRVFSHYGFEMKTIRMVDNPYSAFVELNRSQGVAIFDKAYSPRDDADLRYIPAMDFADTLSVGLAWNPEKATPFLKELADDFSTFFQTDGLLLFA